MLPLVSTLAGVSSSFFSAGVVALVLCLEEEAAVHTADVIEEVVDKMTLNLKVATNLKDVGPSGINILVTTVPQLQIHSLEHLQDLLEPCRHLVLEQVGAQLEQWPGQLEGLMSHLLESNEEEKAPQLLALAEGWSEALETFSTRNFTEFHRPQVVIADMSEAAIYGGLKVLPTHAKTLEEKGRIMLQVAGCKGRLVVCCRSIMAGEHLASLLAMHRPVLLKATEGAEKLALAVQAWALGRTAPLLMTDAALALLPRPPQADTLVLWDLGRGNITRRLTLVHTAMRNVLQPDIKVPLAVVRLLVCPEDVPNLSSLETWLQRCGARLVREDGGELEVVREAGGELEAVREAGPSGTTRRRAEHSTPAVFNLQLSLQNRKRQFDKFCLVVLDDEKIEDSFAKAYEDGKFESQEPLYSAYLGMRRTAEADEEEAMDHFLEDAIPQGLERPVKAASRYPPGPDR